MPAAGYVGCRLSGYTCPACGLSGFGQRGSVTNHLKQQCIRIYDAEKEKAELKERTGTTRAPAEVDHLYLGTDDGDTTPSRAKGDAKVAHLRAAAAYVEALFADRPRLLRRMRLGADGGEDEALIGVIEAGARRALPMLLQHLQSTLDARGTVGTRPLPITQSIMRSSLRRVGW
jgi:hypothetical protein